MKYKIPISVLIFIITFSCKTKEKQQNIAPNVFGIKPIEYVKILKKGIDVDWAKTKQGIANYNKQATIDFKKRGFSHVRIRIKENATEQLLNHIDKIIKDCLHEDLIPIIAYQGNDFKKNPNTENLEKVVDWWKIVAERFKEVSPKVSFDILIEVTKKLNKEPEKLNNLYERVVAEIRKTNPKRILFISPRVRSSPEYLSDLKIPTKHHNYVMAEWHFYAAGPSKTNTKKLWTIGTEAEKNNIRKKIKTAINWQRKTGIYTWVGAWMPSNYNDGDDYSIDEQVAFANFVSCVLAEYKIPFAINSDTKYYNRETNSWNKIRKPVLNAILFPRCR